MRKYPHFKLQQRIFWIIIDLMFLGGVPERFNGAVSKTAGRKTLVSSNLTPSAKFYIQRN